MSNYHILESDTKLSSTRAVFHISIPDENNSVGVNLRTALNYYLGERTIYSIVPDLETDFAAEYAEIIAASIYEHQEQFEFSNAHLPLVNKRSELDARYTTLSTVVVTNIQKRLKYYRLDRDVP